MFERRPMLGLLIGLTICVSIWRISLQEPSLISTEEGYQQQHHHQLYRRQFSISPTNQIDSGAIGKGQGVGGGGGTIGREVSSDEGRIGWRSSPIGEGGTIGRGVSSDEGRTGWRSSPIGEEGTIGRGVSSDEGRTGWRSSPIEEGGTIGREVRSDDGRTGWRSSPIGEGGTTGREVGSNEGRTGWKSSPIDAQMISANNKITTILTDDIQNSNVNNPFSVTYNNHHLPASSSSSSLFSSSSSTSIINPNNNYSKFSSYLNPSSPSYLPTAVNIETLSSNDLNRLINLENFNFLLNQKSCMKNLHARINKINIANINNNNNSNSNSSNNNNNGNYFESPLVLILVHSAPDNYMKRLLIRETWGSYKSPLIRLIFLLGAVNSTRTQKRLELENGMFSDIVQGDFIDAYRNMTYKHVMALKWFTYYCRNVKFILKIDDDVFVNTPYLIEFLNYQAPRRNLLFCQKQIDSRVKRSYRSKWRVSTKEYKGRYYPPYCPGYAILYSPDIAFRLYRKAQETPYFWIDDVHITGTLAQRSNINITSFSSFILDKDGCNSILSGKTDKNNFVFLFTWPDISEEQSRKLWKLIENFIIR